MINGLEGIPGSGKSYEAVVFHVLAALKSGRKVVTNLPLNVDLFSAIDPAYGPLIDVRFKNASVLGSWDANRVDDKGNGNAFELWPHGVEPLTDRVKKTIFTTANSRDSFTRSEPQDNGIFGQVWDFYDPWRHADGRGPLFVIDECHVPFPSVGTSKQVIEWFKLHRHFNVDVLFMTQSFRDMNQSMARLIAMLIKVRKADILGRSGSYIRKVHSGYRGAVISTDERKYQPQFFPLYKSHTQGNSVGESGASDVKPFLVKFNRFKWVWWVGSVACVLYAFWPASKPTTKLVFHESMQRAIKQPVSTSAPGQKPDSPTVVKPAQDLSSEQLPPELDPEPLKDKTIHITGWLRSKTRMVHTFAVAAGGARVFDLQESDLKAAGYTWRVLSDCMGYLTYKDRTRPVTCDPPVISVGSNSKPILIADGSRRSSAETSTAPLQNSMR